MLSTDTKIEKGAPAVKPYLLFDFDGTIADSFGLGLEIINKLAPKYNLKPFTPDQVAEFRSIPTHKAIKQMKIPFYKLPVLIPVFLHEFKHVLPHLEPFEGIRECLTALKEAGFSMALLTSNSRDNVVSFLDNHDLNCFDWIEGGSGLFNKQVTIKKQIHKHKLNKDSLFYVGDETRDIIAAKKTGIKIISVTWGFHTPVNLASYEPDFMADKPMDIFHYISQFGL